MVMSFGGRSSRCQNFTLLTRRREGYPFHLSSMLCHSFFTQVQLSLSLIILLFIDARLALHLASWMNHEYFLSAIGLIRKPDLVSELNVAHCKAVR